MKTWNLIMAAAVLTAGLCAGQARGAAIQSIGSGDWTNGETWSGGSVPTANDDVTIKAGHTVTNPDMLTHDVKSLTIENTGVLTHQANAGSELYKVILNVVNDLTINAGGAINVDERGYAAGNGPGLPFVTAGNNNYGGAGYGGMGGQRYAGDPGLTYGSIMAPTNIGSGANATASGGGAVILAVGGTATVNGVISAAGQSGGTSRGSGSAGSIFLTTGVIAGSGTLRAIGGGPASYGGQGGGGRIAVILTNSTDFGGVVMQAYGGPSSGSYSGRSGAAGTIYQETMTDSPGHGTLIVDNNNQIPEVVVATTQNGKAFSSNVFARIVLRNAGRYGLDTNDILNITTTVVTGNTNRNVGIRLDGGTLLVPSDFNLTNYFIQICATGTTFNPAGSPTVGTNGTLNIQAPWTLSNVTLQAGGILTFDAPVVLNSSLTISAGGLMNHTANGSSEAYKLDLTVHGSLEIQAGGSINVDGKGYASGGPGAPGDDGQGYYGGAGHGGEGGERYVGGRGTAYGSITAPTNIGCQASDSPGGGAVILKVDGTTTVNGPISSSGILGIAARRGGGSGGSIYLITGAIAGSGTLSANGIHTELDWGGCGAGGRIAVVLTNSTSFSNVAFQARSADSGIRKGAAGTIYLKTPAQPEGHGTLLVDAMNLVPDSAVPALATLINNKVTDTTVGTVIITNKAVLRIDSNQSLTVNRDWLNTATFIAANTGATLTFASTNAAMVTGSNAFYNLTITNAGKVVSFEAGRTNTVTGLLKLGASQPGQTVTLQSTTNGIWSYLTLTPGGTQQIARVNVKDNNAGGGQTLLVSVGSVNGGNNINWQFPPSGTMFMVK